MAMNSVLGPEAIHSQHAHSFTQIYQTHGLASPFGSSFGQHSQHDSSPVSPINAIKAIQEKLCTCSFDSCWVSDLLSIIEKSSVAQVTRTQPRHRSFRSHLRPPKGHVCNLQWQQHRASDINAKPATSQPNLHFPNIIMPRNAKRKISSSALPGQNSPNQRQKRSIGTLYKDESARADLDTKVSYKPSVSRANDLSKSKVEASHGLDEQKSIQEQTDDVDKMSNVRKSNRTRRATTKAIEIDASRSNSSAESKRSALTSTSISTSTSDQNSVIQSRRDLQPVHQDHKSFATKRKAVSLAEKIDENSAPTSESGNTFKKRKIANLESVDTSVMGRRSLRSSALSKITNTIDSSLSIQKKGKGSDAATKTNPRNDRPKLLASKRSSSVRKGRLVARTAAVHSTETDAPSISTDAYASDQGGRRGGRGGGRGGRGGHNSRGRGGRGRGGGGGGGGAAGRGRGDSPERPVKHILTADERIEVTRLKKRQAELRSFFHLVGNQQAEILDVLAGRDLANITRKGKAHEKYPEFDEIVGELSHLRDEKTALHREERKLKCDLALKEFKDAKELIELRFKKHVELSKQEHIKGAAGDLAIFKKAIAFGDDDAHTVAGSEADYFPRYHELPEADAQVRGYCSSKIQDEKPFRRDLPSFDEVAARDVMEDEITRPVVEALHRKRAEELARSLHDEQTSAEEQNPENTQAFDALLGVATSDQSKKDIEDITNRVNVKPTHPPFPFDTFGLSKLADVADQAPRAQSLQPYHVLPPPQGMDSFTRQPSNYDNGFTKNLHFPPPPPRLYIPQQPSLVTYPLPDSSIRSAGSLPNIANHNRPPLLPPPLTTKNLPPTSQQHQQQQQHSPHHLSTPLMASNPASRRSLRSIAPQPPQPPPASAATAMPPPVMQQQQTYTFVPPQQPPQSTYYTTPPVRSPASSVGPGRTTSSPASMLATSGGPGPQIYHHIPNGSTHNRNHNHNNQPHGAVSRSNSGSGPSTNQPGAPLNSNTTSKQGGQAGKITMQFFNSTIDGNGKRAILPKP